MVLMTARRGPDPGNEELRWYCLLEFGREDCIPEVSGDETPVGDGGRTASGRVDSALARLLRLLGRGGPRPSAG
jgi:hypothetical protein